MDYAIQKLSDHPISNKLTTTTKINSKYEFLQATWQDNKVQVDSSKGDIVMAEPLTHKHKLNATNQRCTIEEDEMEEKGKIRFIL